MRHLVGIFLFSFLLFIYCNDAAKVRNIMNVRYNYNCSLAQCSSNRTDKSAVNLITIESESPDSPLRNNFIWSNINGPPVIITASTKKSSALKINWPELLPNATNEDEEPNSKTGLYFSESQYGAIGIMCERIYIFDDDDKTGLYTEGKPSIDIDWDKIVWDSAAKTTFHKDDFLRTIFKMRSNHKYLDGSITVKLAIPNSNNANRQKEVPHLKLNNQSISVVFIVDNIQPPIDLKLKNPRLAMTFAVVIQSPTESVTLDSDSESLISDEYTPGVFRIKRSQFQNSDKDTPLSSKNLGYLYWKEVAYTDRRKIISRTVNVYDTATKYDLSTNLSTKSPPFYHFFSHQPSKGYYSLYRFNMIYGKGDTLYTPTNFTDFSFVFGLGEAPQEQLFSVLVKLVIFLCFGVPLLVMLVGLGFLVLRNILRKNDDSELLLAAES